MPVTIDIEQTKTYTLREEGGDYAKIFLSQPNPNAISMTINSSFGTWSHYWGSIGSGGLTFLSSLGIDYVANKFGEANEFKLEETYEAFKKHLKDNYSDEESIDYEAACIELENASAYNDQHGFYSQLETHWFYEDEFYSCVVTGISRQFKAFWDKFWGPFVDQFKQPSNA